MLGKIFDITSEWLPIKPTVFEADNSIVLKTNHNWFERPLQESALSYFNLWHNVRDTQKKFHAILAPIVSPYNVHWGNGVPEHNALYTIIDRIDTDSISFHFKECPTLRIPCDEAMVHRVGYELPGCPSVIDIACRHEIGEYSVDTLQKIKPSWFTSLTPSMPSIPAASTWLPRVPSMPKLPSLSSWLPTKPAMPSIESVQFGWSYLKSWVAQEKVDVLCPSDDDICQYIKDNFNSNSDLVRFFDINSDGNVTRDELIDKIINFSKEYANDCLAAVTDYAKENPFATAVMTVAAIISLYMAFRATLSATSSVMSYISNSRPVTFLYNCFSGTPVSDLEATPPAQDSVEAITTVQEADTSSTIIFPDIFD